jgi:hypothetical protein
VGVLIKIYARQERQFRGPVAQMENFFDTSIFAPVASGKLS